MRGALTWLVAVAISACGATPEIRPTTGPTVASQTAPPHSLLTTSPGAPPVTLAPTTSTSTPNATSGPPIALDELGGQITFSFDDGVWAGNPDGTDRRQLTHDGGFDPSWSPDGMRIAYRLLLAHDDGEIWVVNADGTDAHDLVNDPEFSDWGPAWSPDGSQIAYNSNRIGGLAIWLMNADGSEQEIIGRGHGEYPSWSPDGDQLVYAGGDYYDIHVMNADGTGDRALTTHPAYDMGPAWSPDGAWIAYHTQADSYPDFGEPGMGPEMEIHLVHPDGSDDHAITSDSTEDSFPAWSPDGRFLMWSRHGELVVARPDGSGMIALGPGNFPSWVSLTSE